jgi:predicted nucleotide-binding protein (sugar kinase/HSP70/actin superfamily)
MENKIDLTERVEMYDKVTGEILKQTPEEMIRDSKKFMSLCEVFEVDAGNMEKNIQEMKEKEVQLLTPSYNSDNTEPSSDDLIEVIDTDSIKEDINLIRENLRANVKAIGTILSKFGTDLIGTHADDVSGSVLMGYSELVKSHTLSMKLLIDIHKTAAETLVSVKKLLSEAEEIDIENNSETTINNTINFTGTPAELLASLKERQ